MAKQIILNKTPRRGTHISSNFNVPKDAAGTIEFRADISPDDLVNESLSITISIEQLIGADWIAIAGMSWRGCPLAPGKNALPGFRLGLDNLAGQVVRVSYSIPVRFSVGGTVEIK